MVISREVMEEALTPDRSPRGANRWAELWTARATSPTRETPVAIAVTVIVVVLAVNSALSWQRSARNRLARRLRP